MPDFVKPFKPGKYRKCLTSFLLLGLALFLSACATGNRLTPAQVELSGDGGEVAIVWDAIPRTAPLPPLDHAALLLPMHFGSSEEKIFYMQLDLGHASTVFYSNKWKAIAEKYQFVNSGDKLAAINFKLGDMQVLAKNISIMQREGVGVEWSKGSIEVIGSIGADLIDGRIVVLDFKKDIVQFAREREGLYSANSKFQPFSFSGRRIVMPVTFDGEEKTVMYDSSSGALSWISNEKTFQRLAKKDARPAAFSIRPWDKILTAHTVETSAEVTVGGISLPVKEISYIEDVGFLQELAISGLGSAGMVGNKLFLGKKLIIDTRKMEIALEE
ncbi:hypothetical protein [Undibacterium sp. Tian12W]|uniref:hypothetical protein n=1 Tax=Undibacterium sp. Tian12W TaxID=3413054 RepID=UPI003BF36F34